MWARVGGLAGSLTGRGAECPHLPPGKACGQPGWPPRQLWKGEALRKPRGVPSLRPVVGRYGWLGGPSRLGSPNEGCHTTVEPVDAGDLRADPQGRGPRPALCG